MNERQASHTANRSRAAALMTRVEWRASELHRRDPDPAIKDADALSSEALEKVSDYAATEPASKQLEKGHPDLAARLWRVSQAVAVTENSPGASDYPFGLS